MSPKDNFEPTSEQGLDMPPAKKRGLQTSHKTAIAIALLAVVWMASGVFNDTENANSAVGVDAMKGAMSGAVSAVEVSDEPAETRVRVSTVTSEEHVRKIAILGRIEADKAVFVRAEVPGRISEVVVKRGARVDAGDVLLKIDAENLPALLAEAKARLEQRKIAYDSAKKLSKGGYSSQLNVAQAKADMEAARAQVSGMQRDLENTTITAPFAGVVDELPVEAGDYNDKAGAIVARVIDLTTMNAVGEVVEHDIGFIDLGGVAKVGLPDGRVLNGQVSFIAQSTNALTRTFRVEVTLDVPDRSVPEGVTAELHLPLERVVEHKISSALLTLNDEGAVGVKTVNADGVVVFYPVEMVSDATDGIWLTGLPHEARIITVGQEFVAEGQTVIPVEGALKTQHSAASLVDGEGN